MQNALVFSPQVCNDQKKGLRLPISGFSVSKQKIETKWCHPKMVTPGAAPPPPISDATVVELEQVFGAIVAKVFGCWAHSYVIKTTFSYWALFEFADQFLWQAEKSIFCPREKLLVCF